ncbi:MAG TPA: type IV pilus biogenesis/stability protein PilW [Xanthomonadaceae bacterium]|nr:type IV pilus biogenesis/stability protein PilW [Xanthomonadaceae bacterium]
MQLPRAAVVPLGSALVLAMALGACSRLSFVRPDASRGDYTQTAPVIEVSDGDRVPVLAVRDRLLLAEHRLGAGQLDEAQAQAEAVLDLAPGTAAAHTVLALVAGRRGDTARAGTHFARAAELAPRGVTLNNYGTWLCANGQPAQSLAWFDRALADPAYRSRASALANAGHCAVRAGQDARAERDLREALALDPDSVVALSALAELAYRNGNAFEARAFSQRRLAAGPADARALQLASQIEQKLGDRAAAERYTRRMRAEFGDSPAQAGDL